MSAPRTLSGFQMETQPEGLVLVSDVDGSRHYLNQTAALIYAFCDGATSPGVMAENLGRHFGLAAPPLAEVWRTLGDLGVRGLITQPESPPSDGG